MTLRCVIISYILSFLAMVRIALDFLAHCVYRIRYFRKPPQIRIIESELVLMPATTLAAKIRSRQITSVEVVTAYIERISAINGILNAVVDKNFAQVIEDAKSADEIIASNGLTEEELVKQKPFLGVPFTVKENFQVAGMKQTVGLTNLKNQVSDRDAESVALMKRSGAIVLAVTNISQLCTSWECVNPVYGRTKNPYNTHRIAGGSSGGEGSIIAAAGSVFGIGSDIAGSIRLPALFNGIFGHKPSKNIVSNDGEQPEVSGELGEFLVTGPLCRYSCDLLPVLRVLAGDNVSKLKLYQPVDMKSLKVYYMEWSGSSFLMSKIHPEMKLAQKKVIEHFEKSHGIKAEKVNLSEMASSLPIYLALICKNNYVKNLFTNHLTNGKGKPKIFKEFFKFLIGRSDYTLSTIFATWVDSYITKCGQNRFAEMTAKCESLKTEFEELLGNDGIFLYPSHPTPAVYHRQPLTQFFNFCYAGIFNTLGLPVTQCPLGLGASGLPVGIQVVASLNNDHITIAVAQDLELAFGGWVWPVPKS